VKCYAVAGNCDYRNVDYPNQVHMKLGGIHFFMIHGHRYSELKQNGDYYRTLMLARQFAAEVLIHGHTHIQTDQMIDGIRVVNPGAARNGAYAVIDITDENAIDVKLKRYPL